MEFLDKNGVRRLWLKIKDLIESSNKSVGSVPIGGYVPYAGAVEPTNFKFPNGQELSRTEYSELFEIIGTIYGEGDGSTTFNLPDLTGRTLVMVDSSDNNFKSLGKKVGENSHVLLEKEMPKHTHAFTGSAHSHGVSATTASATDTHTHTIASHTHGIGNHTHYYGYIDEIYGTALTVAQIPSHQHSYHLAWGDGAGNIPLGSGTGNSISVDRSTARHVTGNTGSGNKHWHEWHEANGVTDSPSGLTIEDAFTGETTNTSDTGGSGQLVTSQATSNHTHALSCNTDAATAGGTNAQVGGDEAFNIIQKSFATNYLIRVK